MLEKAYSNSVLWTKQNCDLYKGLTDGREIPDDMPRSGRPSTSSTENINIVMPVLEK